jgi:hypothetical protein
LQKVGIKKEKKKKKRIASKILEPKTHKFLFSWFLSPGFSSNQTRVEMKILNEFAIL